MLPLAFPLFPTNASSSRIAFMSENLLFPVKKTRRDFLRLAASAAVVGTLGTPSFAARKPVTIGTGTQSYTLDENWGKLPAGMSYGLGCAVVVDSKDRVIVTSRSASPCVAIFDTDGKLLETWTKDFALGVSMTPDQVKATAHGLYWSKEPKGEFLYWTENVSGGPNKKDAKAPASAKIGARIYKTDMAGKVLYTLGNVAEEGSTSQKFDFTNPTDVAVAPNGDIYIVDGYGSQKLCRFDSNFKHLKTIGTRGKEHGQFATNHGVWVSTLRKDPEIYIADRANDRIEIFSPELEYKRTIEGVRKPCCFYQHDGLIYIPELDARVTVIDDKDKVVAHLGDGRGVAKNDFDNHPDKFSTPHALTLSSKGDLFVVEWVANGRVRKLKKSV